MSATFSEVLGDSVREREINERQENQKAAIAAFDKWWRDEGSAMRPNPGEDAEEHVHRVCKIAWINGSFR